jgi:hypothetical protein
MFSTQQLSADGIIAGMENGNLTIIQLQSIHTRTHTNTHAHTHTHTHTHTHLPFLLVDLKGPGLQKCAERGFGLAKSKNLTFDYSREALAPVGMCGKVCC